MSIMQKRFLSFESLESKKVLSSNTVVAVVDSGADLSSSYISSHLWTNPGEIAGDNIDNDHNGYIDDIHGWNFVDNNNDVSDGYGHGTAVAGLASASNSDSLMILKFQNSQGVGFTGDAIRAIDYAIMMKNNYSVHVGVINASWGGTTGYSSILYDSIKNASSSNIMFVAAAGNDGTDSDLSPRYPSCYDSDNIISVGAICSDKTWAAFSNYGKNNVDLATWGTSVYSTSLNNSYGYFSGTSFSAPIVSDAVASIEDSNPSWNIDQVKSYIFSTVEKLGGLADKVLSGGILNSSLVYGVVAQPFKVLATPTTSEVSKPVSIVTQPSASMPIVNVEVLSLKRLKGWAFDNHLGSKAVKLNVLINDKVVRTFWANHYRGDLRKILGSNYHGFSVALATGWFHKGENSVTVKVGGNVVWGGKINK
jgi:subtilisin family serine protease